MWLLGGSSGSTVLLLLLLIVLFRDRNIVEPMKEGRLFHSEDLWDLKRETLGHVRRGHLLRESRRLGCLDLGLLPVKLLGQGLSWSNDASLLLLLLLLLLLRHNPRGRRRRLGNAIQGNVLHSEGQFHVRDGTKGDGVLHR